MVEQCYRTRKTGSPPQVRGKQGGFMPTIHINGITPAGAGKTFVADSNGCGVRDHPRRCGENIQRFVIVPLI